MTEENQKNFVKKESSIDKFNDYLYNNTEMALNYIRFDDYYKYFEICDSYGNIFELDSLFDPPKIKKKSLFDKNDNVW